MQHRYVPDLGDYSKFAVIRALAGDDLTTALIWYLTDPHELGEADNNDGRHRDYLRQAHRRAAELRACLPQVYDKLAAIERANDHHIAAYRKRNVLPAACYYEAMLHVARGGGTAAAAQRPEARRRWLDGALKVAAQAEMVVLDPDNGLLRPRQNIPAAKRVKYATLDECAAFYGGGERSLVVYQHATRHGTVAKQLDTALDLLSSALVVPRGDCFALRFHRGSSRAYLVVPEAGMAPALRDRARRMIEGPWGRGGHFTMQPSVTCR